MPDMAPVQKAVHPELRVQRDGRQTGDFALPGGEKGNVTYDPQKNSLTLGRETHGKDGSTARLNTRFNAASLAEPVGAVIEQYKKTGALPAVPVENFTCSGKFGTVNVARQTAMENMTLGQRALDANPALHGLVGQGPAYGIMGAGPMAYARGEEGLNKLIEQAKTQCGLAAPKP